MTGGKEFYYPLRQLYRRAEFRRFRAKHRSNRWADFLGFTPNGDAMVGFWDGSEEPVKFAPDEISWTRLVVYV